jgi:hypothetical protein
MLSLLFASFQSAGHEIVVRIDHITHLDSFKPIHGQAQTDVHVVGGGKFTLVATKEEVMERIIAAVKTA